MIARLQVDFEIPEDLKMVQSLVRDFVHDQLKPLERDVLGRVAGLKDARAYLPPETEDRLIKMATEIGLWGLGVPEDLGGMGLSTLGNCLAEEEIAQTIVPFTFGDVTPILFECNAEQTERYFRPHFQRQSQAYIALLEPQDRTGFPNMRTTAVKANGDFVISGRKMSYSRPGGDYFGIVFAATSGEAEGPTCFLVDKGTPGFTVTGGEEAAGWRTQIQAPLSLAFADCRVPVQNILGQTGQAFHLGKKWLPARRLVRGARCLGVAQRLLEEARAQAESWESYGQHISKRPSIESALADIAVSIHACRLVVYEAAWKADGNTNIKREAAMVKLFATQMIRTVADRVSHIFNGPPYIQGLPMERLCSDALAANATDLALELQSSIIASDIMKGLKV
ncbi:MAG: acyl-CoA/acyl-ACP dehydrogenase [Dehalococcoidia bacterium]|nr:acyl-CoA/acyl-ACP dehydrogenase [Dehalococcoidia bacterium]